MEYRVKRTGDDSKELYHWKYIDKVKTKAGKWRYIYADVKDALSSEDEHKEYDDARENHARLDEARKYTAELFLNTKPHTKERDKAYDRYKEKWDEYQKSDREKTIAKRDYEDAKTFRGKMEDLGDVYRKWTKKKEKQVSKGKRYVNGR